MRIPASSISLLLAWSATATATPSLRFTNNDTLAGIPQSLALDKVIWESKLLDKPAEFPTAAIQELTLSNPAPDATPDHEAVISLTNGDSIRGQLASITDEALSLDTWFAGRLEFNRLMVSGVKIEETGSTLYRGPSSLNGWIQSPENPAWTYSQTSFRSTRAGGIARDGLLADESAIHFDLAWKGDSIRLKVVLFSDDPATDNPGTGYEINFMRGRVHLREIRSGRFQGSGHSRALMEDERASIEIRASKTGKRIALLINDQLIDVWNSPDFDNRQSGKALHFIESGTMPTMISNIRIKKWDGIMDRIPQPPGQARHFGFNATPEPGPDPESQDETSKDRMNLANGDSLPGEVSSITNGIITLQTPLGEIELPVSRLRSVALRQENAERCKRYNGDVRAWFPDGSSIVFRLDDGDAGKIHGFSQNFGNATFDTTAFNRIEFNIHSPDYRMRDASKNW
jgi:hypothetical protein